MRVNRLFIIRVGTTDGQQLDKEITEGGDELCRKYINRKENPMKKDSIFEYNVVKAKDPKRDYEVERVSKVEPKPADLADDNVGVYVIAHGTSASCGGLLPKEMAELLKGDMKFKKIRKLCMISCNLGNTRPGVVSNPEDDKTYLEKLCRALGEGEVKLEPKVAGWDCFVTVAYPGNDQTSAATPAGSKAIKLDPKHMKSVPVRAPLDADTRKRLAHKKVWVLEGGKVKPLDSGWSDSGKD